MHHEETTGKAARRGLLGSVRVSSGGGRAGSRGRGVGDHHGDYGARGPAAGADGEDGFAEAAPTSGIQFGAIGGQGYAGGMPLGRRIASEILPPWILEGDQPTHPLEARHIPAPKQPRAESSTHSGLFEQVRHIADSTGISILVPSPHWLGLGSQPDPYGVSLADYLESIGARGSGLRQHKWHDGILLITHTGWWAFEQVLVPWAVEKEVRRQLARPEGVSVS